MNKLLLISLWAIATSTMTGDLNNTQQVKAPIEIKQTEQELVKDPVKELYDEMKLQGPSNGKPSSKLCKVTTN